MDLGQGSRLLTASPDTIELGKASPGMSGFGTASSGTLGS
jgi:hypothetical protein